MPEFVSLPIPTDMYADVVQFLAQRLRHRDENVAPAATAADSPWALPERLAALARAIQTETPRALLRVTSQRPDEWVSLREICDAENLEPSKAAAELAGFTKLLKSQFGTAQKPVEVRQGPPGEGSQYRMSTDIAARWEQARSWRVAVPTP